VSITTSKTQPVLVGGLVMGLLSALPIVSVGNCCCLWVISGGVVAAYLLQQNEPGPITQGDGALVGLLAGLAGACIYLVVSIPLSIVLGGMERELIQRIMESNPSMPPQWRDLMGARGFARSGVGVVALRMIGFVVFLFIGSIFSTLGGLLGAVIFHKPLPAPAPPDTPPTIS